MTSSISWHKFRVPTSGTLMQVDNGHFQAIFGPYAAILVENIVFLPNFDVWNWFLYTRRVQKYYRKQWKKIQWRGVTQGKNYSKMAQFSPFLELWPYYAKTQNENWYGSYFSHDEHVCQVREKSEGVLLRNLQNERNSQNGHKMAKIKKWLFLTQKIVLLFINYIISTFFYKYL